MDHVDKFVRDAPGIALKADQVHQNQVVVLVVHQRDPDGVVGPLLFRDREVPRHVIPLVPLVRHAGLDVEHLVGEEQALLGDRVLLVER